MSLPAQTPIASFTANGVTTVFSFPFLIQRAGDLVVTADDVEVTTGFTASGIGTVSGGAVIFAVAPSNGVEITIRRHITLERTADYQTGGDFREEVLDADLDRLWQALQEITAGFAEGVIVISGTAGNVTILDAGDFFVGGNVESALQQLASAIYSGLNIEAESTGPVQISVGNSLTGALSSARIMLFTGTNNSTWTMEMLDAAGVPIALEKTGTAVTKKQTWAAWHQLCNQAGTQVYFSHNGTSISIRNSNDLPIIEGTASSLKFLDDNIVFSGGPVINIDDTAGVLQINGVQVVRARLTGWSADTGTSKRTANATYSGTAEIAYTQATVQTLMDKVRDLSQTVKALKDDLISHGLIGT